MRITGGELRGRLLKSPPDRVRPTQDRVRAALFSALADRIPDCRFLDLFAGSGAVGLEAWSRGAGFVCWVESDATTLKILKQNVAALCHALKSGSAREPPERNLSRVGVSVGTAVLSRPYRENTQCGALRTARPTTDEASSVDSCSLECHFSAVVRSDAIRFLTGWRGERPFDIIFADPPYDRDGRQGWLRKALQALSEVPILAENGLLVYEQSVDEPEEPLGQWVSVRDKTYGETRLRFLCR